VALTVCWKELLKLAGDVVDAVRVTVPLDGDVTLPRVHDARMKSDVCPGASVTEDGETLQLLTIPVRAMPIEKVDDDEVHVLLLVT
jgi:hypothetical protein